MKAWEARDPILLLRGHLLESHAATEEGLNKVQKEVEARIEQASRFAIESPAPSPGTVADYVYSSR
jgi:pyruvate dehydrogenase E1 component alpha subunit